MAQMVEILPHGRQWAAYSTYSEVNIAAADVLENGDARSHSFSSTNT